MHGCLRTLALADLFVGREFRFWPVAEIVGVQYEAVLSSALCLKAVFKLVEKYGLVTLAISGQPTSARISVARRFNVTGSQSASVRLWHRLETPASRRNQLTTDSPRPSYERLGSFGSKRSHDLRHQCDDIDPLAIIVTLETISRYSRICQEVTHTTGAGPGRVLGVNLDPVTWLRSIARTPLNGGWILWST